MKLHLSSRLSCGCEQPCHPSLAFLLFLLSWKESPGWRPGCHSGPRWGWVLLSRRATQKAPVAAHSSIQRTPKEAKKGFGACLMLCSFWRPRSVLWGRALAGRCRHCWQCSQLSQEYSRSSGVCHKQSSQFFSKSPLISLGHSSECLLSQLALSPSCICSGVRALFGSCNHVWRKSGVHQEWDFSCLPWTARAGCSPLSS